MVAQPGFFDLDERYRALAETGDPLIKLAELIEFEVFRSPLLRRSPVPTVEGSPPAL